MPATAAPYRQLAATITEGLSVSARVDRETGVIRNVKLIGLESKNSRIYPSTVLKAAVHLYEGAKVNIDHPDGNDPAKARRYGERFGVIRNVRFVESSGNFGDFHFNPKHPQAEQVIWDAENNPESLGFSHNALLRLGEVQNGKQVIESIVAIRSMDLVADPATTSSLFESELPTMDPVVIPTDTTSDPKAAMKGVFRQMIMAAVDDESLDMKATMKKIGEIMKAQTKLMGGGETPTEEAPAEESIHAKNQIALLQQQVNQFQAKERQAERAKSIDVALTTEGLDPRNTAHVSELFSKQLLATEGEQDRLELIKDRASLLGAKSRGGSSHPVYQPSNSNNSTNATEQIDVKEFARRLRA